MFKKLTLTVTLMIVLTSIGCVCSSGSRCGIGGYSPCGPCGASYECTPCGMSACDPVAPCEQATCACGPSACEPSTCAPSACEPCACEPAACGVAACESASPGNPCDCGRGFGMRTGFGFGSEKAVKGHGVFSRAPAEEMYVTRGPRDFFYSPNSSQMR